MLIDTPLFLYYTHYSLDNKSPNLENGQYYECCKSWHPFAKALR